jgi:hypothetical protein
MSGLFGTPELLRYPCECCARVFSPPPARIKLRLRDRFVVFGLALGQTLKRRDGLISTYRTIRPRHIARLNERAFERFALSFQFCDRCRGFICQRCWRKRQRACRVCVAAERLPLLELAARPGVEIPPCVVSRAVVGTRPAVDTGVPAGSLRARLDIGGRTGGRDGIGLPSRPIQQLGLLSPFGPILRPGPLRTATSVAIMTVSLMLVAAEAAYVFAAPFH